MSPNTELGRDPLHGFLSARAGCHQPTPGDLPHARTDWNGRHSTIPNCPESDAAQMPTNGTKSQTVGRVHKLWSLYTAEYYSARGGNKPQLLTATLWMTHTCFVLNKRSRTQTATHCNRKSQSRQSQSTVTEGRRAVTLEAGPDSAGHRRLFCF